MQNHVSQNKQAKVEIYLTLAEFFKFPTEDFYQDVMNGTVDQLLVEMAKEANYTKPTVQLKGRFPNFSEMKQTYMRCFMGVIKPYAPPIESVYKVWTTDPTAGLSIAKSKGYLFGDAALHIRHLFEQFHLEIPDDYAKMPDHLTLLLEFLAFLIKETSEEHVNQFVADHLDWLEDFKHELLKVNDSSFYIDVTDIIISFINNEKRP
ncbi:molecular chaperone [Tepidibacillus infernus]|uniref:TorD/DmsD family molecular chaperone n=1 Tax=Tepidibacillus infernus TaxID=1806172 RepID=UPI003B6ED64E